MDTWGWRFKAPFFAYFLWRSKESKCRPAQGSMKIESKSNIESAIAKAAGNPRRKQTRSASKHPQSKKTKIYPNPRATHAAWKPQAPAHATDQTQIPHLVHSFQTPRRT